MARYAHRKKFYQSKRIRRAILGIYCECDCGKRATLGHHRLGKQFNDWWHIALKCDECEREAHKQHKQGNPESQMKLIRRNDLVIAQALGLSNVPK